ncbi:MAG: FtsQ-type POTRA domain-containing protein [Chlorobiaceae bacterium]|nr:FtsQ-type POTRA domain-containing protein [Chlorobiaceae bacterium]NTW62595.1 FtsQ-type POTRA domain-containing protein [Chlorobiaceae bacterium]
MPDSGYGGSWKALFLILFLVIIVLAWLGYHASGWQKEVLVRDIVIEDARHVSVSELSARLKRYSGMKVQKLDIDEVRASVMAIPYIRDATVSKELNGILRVRVIERVPLALMVDMQLPMVIDQEGVLVPDRKGFSDQAGSLLHVSGISRLDHAERGLRKLAARDYALIREFTAALQKSEYAALLIREFHFQNNNGSSVFARGSAIRFIVGNDGNFKEKLKKFEIFWQKVIAKTGFERYETVDLRFKDRVFAKEVTLPETVKKDSL